MPPSITCATTAADRVSVELLALPVFTDRKFGPGADLANKTLGRGLAAFMAEADFNGKCGEVLAVPTQGKLGAKAVVLVGIGERAKIDADVLRRAAATFAKRAAHVQSAATTLLDAAPDSLDKGAAAQAIAEGLSLGTYQFLKYKGDAKPSKLKRVVLLGRSNVKVREGLTRGTRVAEAVIWARDLVNEPAAAKSPARVATLARQLGRKFGLKVTVLSGEQLEREGLGGVIGVGQGSVRLPRFVRLAYEPRGARATLAFIGKGVVFDSGGLSLKTGSGMETMKTDMSGAAAVLAAMSTLRDLGVKTRVYGYVPLVENMPSGNAIRPGDVLTHRNGTTVEVLNTDAEGRLILADALAMASEEEPDAMIDLATLTGACMVALGDKVAGLMGNDDGWIDQVRAAAGRAGESVWPLPLPEEYRKLLDSEVADMKNISHGGYGGALTAGLFLKEFVGDVPWTHLDIAGPARAASDDSYITRGGTGFGVRTLVELARTFRAPK